MACAVWNSSNLIPSFLITLVSEVGGLHKVLSQVLITLKLYRTYVLGKAVEPGKVLGARSIKPFGLNRYRGIGGAVVVSAYPVILVAVPVEHISPTEVLFC
jgi:hypothetical protein